MTTWPPWPRRPRQPRRSAAEGIRMPDDSSPATAGRCGCCLMVSAGWSAWGQQQGPAAAGGVGDDLAVVVDRGGVLDLMPGSGRDQGVEVLHGAAGVDQVSADHHAIVVDRRREEAAQVGDGAVTVQEPLVRAAGIHRTGDLPVVVD